MWFYDVTETAQSENLSPLSLPSIFYFRERAGQDWVNNLNLNESGGGMMSLDLAFIIDCTGSTASALTSIKAEIVNIAQNIPRKVAEQCKSTTLLLKIALIPFRDLCDSKPAHLNFSPVPAFNPLLRKVVGMFLKIYLVL